jgi:hypothetical protein
MKGSIAASMLVVAGALAACNYANTYENQGSSNMSNDERAAARAAVDPLRDCYDKPWFDMVSASDHHTIIKGMTPIEREVCSERMRLEPNEP